MGIGAVIAFNPGASVEENREAMTAAAEQVKTGQITFAVRDTVFEDKEIKKATSSGFPTAASRSSARASTISRWSWSSVCR